jgi:hypothetical protein
MLLDGQPREKRAFEDRAFREHIGKHAYLVARLAAYITDDMADMRPDVALRFIARRVLADLPREKDPTP